MEESREKKYAYWLGNIPGVGDKTIRYLLSVEQSPEVIYRDFTDKSLKAEEHLSQKYGYVQPKQSCGQKTGDSCEQAEDGRQAVGISEKSFRKILQKMRDHALTWQPEAEYESLKQRGIRFLTVFEEAYPWRLKMIPDPPYGLYAKGKLPQEKLLSVAVIGARECSEYGRYVGTELGKALGANGVQVISGMARGIDGISQRAALEAGGASFGVLGCGVDVCYPAQNQALYDRLLVQGGILSANPPGTLPKPALFPPRNRIVSGLSDVVIVVEARQQSGTLITVDMALEQGREVYVVPGRVTDRLSDGCNKLMKQGAGILLSPEAFLQEMKESFPDLFCRKAGSGAVRNEQAIPEGEGVGKNEQEPTEDARVGASEHWESRIYNLLDLTPISMEQISQATGSELSYAKLQQILMRLCLEGKIKQASPGFYSKEKP